MHRPGGRAHEATGQSRHTEPSHEQLDRALHERQSPRAAQAAKYVTVVVVVVVVVEVVGVVDVVDVVDTPVDWVTPVV